MSPALASSLRARLGPWAASVLRALPRAWRSSPRRRRFLVLALCAPGFAAVAALPLHKNLWALIGGTLAMLAAVYLRSLSEPHLQSGSSS
jgi:hypothetical protein